MRFIHTCFAISIALIFANFFALNAQPQKFPIEGTSGKWFVDEERRVKDATFGEFLGRKSLMIKKGSHILRSGVEFQDGTIEFDVAPLAGSQFIAVMFRRSFFQNYENIYLRPAQSGNFQALQYAPVINASSTWQLYPEFNRTIDLPKNKWTHVKIDVQGSSLKVFINKTAKPRLEVARLRGILKKKGIIGFWSRVVDSKSQAWSAAFSNISITPRTPLNSEVKRPNPPTGILNSWRVAKPIENKEGAVMSLPKLEGWKPIRAEESGLINLSRALGPVRGRWTGFAKTNINSEKAKTALLEFGYSDDITVFLNGESIYRGVNTWSSRYPRYLGYVQLGNESVFLKLKPGNNELIFAVTDQRFGWGFIAKMIEID